MCILMLMANVWGFLMNLVSATREYQYRGIGVRYRLLEMRKHRGALQRFKTAKSYQRVFKDAMQRVVKRETDNILRAAKK